MNDDELKKLHYKILEIAEYFDCFCRENDIVYYLMGGSALGAIRHSGFIPWDDDFDVFMDYDNYNKLLKIIDDNLDKDRFYFQIENSEEWPMYFSKLRMNNTTFIEKDIKDRHMHHGIYIDIMCLNNTSKITAVRYLQYFAARMLNARALLKKGYDTDSTIKRLLLSISKYLINGFVKWLLLKIVRMFNSKETLLVGHFFGRAPFKKTSFPKTFLGRPRYTPFEHLSLPVPEFSENYLEVRYGKSYMDIPSDEEKAKYPSHAYIVDTSKSYERYMHRS